MSSTSAVNVTALAVLFCSGVVTFKLRLRQLKQAENGSKRELRTDSIPISDNVAETPNWNQGIIMNKNGVEKNVYASRKARNRAKHKRQKARKQIEFKESQTKQLKEKKDLFRLSKIQRLQDLNLKCENNFQSLLVEVQSSYVERMKEYLLSNKNVKRLLDELVHDISDKSNVWVELQSDGLPLLENQIQHEQLFLKQWNEITERVGVSRHVYRVYPLRYRCKKIEEIIATGIFQKEPSLTGTSNIASKTCSGNHGSPSFRIICSDSKLTARVLDFIKTNHSEISLCASHFEWVLYIYEYGEEYFFDMISASTFMALKTHADPTRPGATGLRLMENEDKKGKKKGDGESEISRARWKMKEALQHSDVTFSLSSTASTASFTAIDVGAAPGGWSQVLSERCSLVVAVDPAELASSLASVKNIIHLKCLANEARERIQAGQVTGVNSNVQFDYLVCDMNMWPTDAAKVIIELTSLLRCGGLLILTFKLSHKNQQKGSKIEGIRDNVLNILQEYYHQFKLEWLFSNTALERTLFALKK